MITWTITADAEPQGAEPGETYYEVNGVGDDENSPHQDPHDPRHFPTFEQAVRFLIGSKAKIGDTIRYAGSDTGKIIHVAMVIDREAGQITYDVGTRTIERPDELIAWLATTLEQGDTVAYLTP